MSARSRPRPGAAGLAHAPVNRDADASTVRSRAAAPGLHRPRADVISGTRRAQVGSVHRQRQHPAPKLKHSKEYYVPHVQQHGGLQGPAAGRPGRRVLQGPFGRALRLRPGPGAPALLDQHLPQVAAGPPVPLRRPQRRDQHGQGQLQLDEGARGRDVLAGAAGRPEEAVSHQLRRPVRHRHLRQLPRAADDGRLPAGPGRDDDDPGALGAAHHDGRAPQGLLRVPRVDDGALGRPGSIVFTDGRRSAPRWTATACGLALLRHRRRPRHHGFRIRRAAVPEEDRAQVAPCSPARCS